VIPGLVAVALAAWLGASLQVLTHWICGRYWGCCWHEAPCGALCLVKAMPKEVNTFRLRFEGNW